MNCKPGDLAVIVRSAVGNAGAIVEILKPLGVEPFYMGRTWHLGASRGQFSWLVRSISSPLKSFGGGTYHECPVPDCVLRPIRPSEGQDETLTWAPVPTKEAA